MILKILNKICEPVSFRGLWSVLSYIFPSNSDIQPIFSTPIFSILTFLFLKDFYFNLKCLTYLLEQLKFLNFTIFSLTFLNFLRCQTPITTIHFYIKDWHTLVHNNRIFFVIKDWHTFLHFLSFQLKHNTNTNNRRLSNPPPRFLIYFGGFLLLPFFYN